jgi:energy-coupling factor transporter ATP-binding protein EcfA2
VKICGIELHDTYGCSHFKVGGFSVLRITGQNGSGKSSILRALSYLFSGGTDPSVIRKGADQSIVILALDDGTKISKTTRPKRARKGGDITGYVVDLEVTQPDGTPRAAPQSYINELGSALAVDPSTLLRIDATTVPGRRALAAELLKLVPVSFEPDEVNRACSYRSSVDVPRGSEDAIALPVSPEAPLSLDDLKKASAQITEQRRREGQIKSDTDGAISRLQQALPEFHLPLGETAPAARAAAQDERALRVALDEAEQYRREIEAAVGEAKLEVEKRKGVAVAAATQTWSEAVAAVNADIDAQIKALEARRNELNATAKDDLDAARSAAIVDAQTACAEIDAEAAPKMAEAIASVTQAKDAIAGHARAATLREEIEVQLATHRAAAWKYDQLSEVLQRLESLRLEKLQHLPVAGLVVEDGTPYLDEIPWQNVNLERRVEAVIQICTQQSGKVPLVLWDDAEHADGDNREAIEQGLVAAGYQVLEAVVCDRDGLAIEVIQ